MANLALRADRKAKHVSGSVGCNRIAGAYTPAGDRLSFGQMAGTMWACLKGMGQERAMLQILAVVTNWKVAGRHLDRVDEHGAVVAQFEVWAAP